MRIRSIKPEFWRSDDIDELRIPDRLLFIGLWSYVDDNGVGIYSIKDIVGDLFAGDMLRDSNETLIRVKEGLKALFEHGLIEIYSQDGRDYLAITNWSKHQRVPNPNKPRYPLPSNDSEPCFTGINESLIRPNEDLGTGTGEQGNRGTDIPPIAPQGATTKNKTQPRTPIPPDWQPDEAARTLASEYNIDIEKSAEKFRLWAEAKGGRLADWDKRFRLWLIGEHQYARGQPAKTPTPTPDKHVSKPHHHSPGCEHVAALLKPYDLSHKNLNGFGSSPWIQAASTLADQLNQGIDTTQALQTALKEAK